MAQPSKPPREGRIKIEAQLKVADREALDRYCECHNLTITQFVTNRVREYHRKMLGRLIAPAREAYMAGELLWSEMSDEEKDAFRAPRATVLAAETDERLTRLARIIPQHKSEIVATWARRCEENWLKKLTELERQRYLAGEIDGAEARKILNRGQDPPPDPEPQPKPDDPEQQQLRTLATNPGLREFA